MPEFERINRDRQLIWPDGFYLETNAKKREELVKSRLETDDSEENRIRYQLWKKRYTIPGKGFTGADYYMRMLLNLDLICEKKRSLFGKKAFYRGVEEVRDIFCLGRLKEKPEYAPLWKEEFVNLWRLYIRSCMEDSNYGGIVLGMGRMSDDRLISKIRNDIEQKTASIPEEMGLYEEMTPFRQAAWEAFYYLTSER